MQMSKPEPLKPAITAKSSCDELELLRRDLRTLKVFHQENRPVIERKMEGRAIPKKRAKRRTVADVDRLFEPLFAHNERRNRNQELASRLWHQLVINLGPSEAKKMMLNIMGGRKVGRPRSEEDLALERLIDFYVFSFGLELTDSEIARWIHKNEPYFLKYGSGLVLGCTKELNEACPDDNPIVGRGPLVRSYKTLKKRVERVRQSLLDYHMLPPEYAPRKYYLDSKLASASRI
jgi:hypothetical protein